MDPALLDRALAVILALTGFTVAPNPKGDGADVLLAHAVPDAEIVVAYDGKVLLTDNYPAFLKAPDRPVFATLPGPRAVLRQAVDVMEQTRPVMRSMFGFDSIAAMGATCIVFVDLPDVDGEPARYFAAARWPVTHAQMLHGMAARGASEIQVHGRPVIRNTDGKLMAFTDDGVLLFGDAELVSERVAPGWKPPPRPRGSTLAVIAEVLDQRPFFAIASIPSPATIAYVNAEAAGFPADLYAGHAVAVGWAHAHGIGWTYQARDAAMVPRVKLASEGTVEILRSLHVAPRAALQIASAALPSYAGYSRTIDELIASNDEILKALAPVSGDGRFTARITVAGTRVTADLRAKRISEVVPAVALLAFGGFAFIAAADDDEAPAAAEPPVHALPLPKKPPPPKKKMGPRPVGERGR